MAQAADAAAPAPQAADGVAPAPKLTQTPDLNYAIEVNSYGLRRTWWWRLAFLSMLTAAA